MTTEDAFLADITAKPDDDLPRLVYADWLEENGESERAAFIRVQILIDQNEYDTGGHTAPKDYLTEESRLWAWIDRHEKLDAIPTDGRWCAFRNRVDFEHYGTGRSVLIRRGFVDEIRCTLAEWCGGEECPECVRCEYVRGVPTVQRLLNCRHCRGTGRTAGIGPQVVRKHPVTKVVVTDREPARVLRREIPERLLAPLPDSGDGMPDEFWMWFDDSTAGVSAGRNYPASSRVPPDIVWNSLAQLFATRQDARDALSDALIAWAKSQVPHLATTPVTADLTQ